MRPAAVLNHFVKISSLCLFVYLPASIASEKPADDYYALIASQDIHTLNTPVNSNNKTPNKSMIHEDVYAFSRQSRVINKPNDNLNIIHNHRFIKKQPENTYTIILKTSRNINDLTALQQHYKNSLTLRCYHSGADENAYYLLGYGIFDSRIDAHESLKQLPQTLKTEYARIVQTGKLIATLSYPIYPPGQNMVSLMK